MSKLFIIQKPLTLAIKPCTAIYFYNLIYEPVLNIKICPFSSFFTVLSTAMIARYCTKNINKYLKENTSYIA